MKAITQKEHLEEKKFLRSLGYPVFSPNIDVAVNVLIRYKAFLIESSEVKESGLIDLDTKSKFNKPNQTTIHKARS